jgi:hypothetical protein
VSSQQKKAPIIENVPPPPLQEPKHMCVINRESRTKRYCEDSHFCFPLLPSVTDCHCNVTASPRPHHNSYDAVEDSASVSDNRDLLRQTPSLSFILPACVMFCCIQLGSSTGARAVRGRQGTLAAVICVFLLVGC